LDLLTAAKDFGLPVLGAVAGFVATSYAVRTEVKQLKSRVATLTKGWRLEFDNHKEDARTRREEHEEELEKKYEDLKKQLKELEENLHRWQRESSHSFASDSELTNFIQDQQRQWREIQRTLGQIEGMLKKLPP
jgi:chromosome segregation ATPase